MSKQTLEEFNEARKSQYRKDEESESFLLKMNQTLREKEVYRDYPESLPIIFIFGPPRSGTTLLSQVVAYSLDVGYINNLMARFWLAPLHGIQFSKTVLGDGGSVAFQSDYARTNNLSDIHEFGYFWRDLLDLHTMDDIVNVKQREPHLDWQYIRRVLVSMQHQFGKPLVFKNIYGAYYLRKFQNILKKVIGIYILRDPLDTAVSILNARKKYYGDPNIWWSYTPPEYNELKSLDYWHQIAGQIIWLDRFYENEITGMESSIIRVQYEELCENPVQLLHQIQAISESEYGDSIDIDSDPPTSFNFNTYPDDKIKQQFKQAFADFN